MSRTETPLSNHSVEANRRRPAPLHAGNHFGSPFCAPPAVPAAVAHLSRSTMDAAHARHRSAAFSLVELLIVISTLILLAALSLVAVSTAKQRAKSAQCWANLHQQGIALNAFVADHGEYPLYLNRGYLTGKYSHHGKYFRYALFPEHDGLANSSTSARNWEDSGVWDCPAARRPSTLPSFEGYSDYGYNSDGVIGRPGDSPLGLGGRGGEDEHAPPVGETEVTQPTDMLAFGDGFMGWGGIIQEGLGKIGRRFTAQEKHGSTHRAHRRHGGRLNFVYCDGHTESLQVHFAFAATTDEALKKWNRDNEPHRERSPK